MTTLRFEPYARLALDTAQWAAVLEQGRTVQQNLPAELTNDLVVAGHGFDQTAVA